RRVRLRVWPDLPSVHNQPPQAWKAGAMRRVRVLTLAMLVILSPLFGCFTLADFVHVDTLRSEEPRRPVNFESPAVAERFEQAVHEHRKSSDGSVSATGFSVLFVASYQRVKKLSENAFYNDQVAACDLNQDGLISQQELDCYRARFCSATSKHSTDDD